MGTNESVENVSEAFQRIELTLDLSVHDDTCQLAESPLVTPKELLFCTIDELKVEQDVVKENVKTNELDEPANQVLPTYMYIHVHV